jgi:eukaryotic-like serine/threonine-protein kinase
VQIRYHPQHAQERPLSVSIADFWRLLVDSRLFSSQQVQQLAGEFGQVRAASGGANAKALAEWLLGRRLLSPYQARILLAGRPGPFDYGDYKVYDRIDSGRLAGQFRAVHAPTGHPVLLEFLTGSAVSDPQQWAAAASGVATACSIISPHVQRYWELVDLPGFKFIVGEDLRGQTLDHPLAKGRLPPVEACRVVRLAAIGLAHMHHFGRVHGDVRLDNVLLEPGGSGPENVKLLFAAHLLPRPFDFSQQEPGGRLAVAADYLAPELLHPGRVPDARTDIYALGCVLYALLAGGPPFAGGTIQQKLTRHASEPIRPLEALGVPPPLTQTVAYMMAKNPAVRFASAAQVIEQLTHFVEPASLHAQPPSPPPTLAALEYHLQQRRAHEPALGPSAGASFAFPPGSTAPPPTLVAPAAASPATPTAAPQAPAIQLDVPARKRSTLTAEEALRRRAQAKQRKLIVGLVATGMVAIAGIVALGMLRPFGNQSAAVGGPEDARPQPLERPSEAETDTRLLAPSRSGSKGDELPAADDRGSHDAAASDGGPPVELVADDGQTLWASPTSGPPVELRCVPPEGQVFVMVRPAEMLASPEGAKVLQALGPDFDRQRQAWEAASGVPFGDIERLLITLHNNDAQFPRMSFVVTTQEAFPKEDLLARWGNPSPVQEMGETFYTSAAWSYYIPSGSKSERTFAMGQARDMQEVAAVAGEPPRLFPGMERLRRATDSQRHLTVLFFPQFLFNDDGGPLFAGPREKIRGPLAWLLGDELQAASASAHFEETFFFEMRMLGTLDNDPHKLARVLRDRLSEVPQSLEDYFVGLMPPPYWRKLAFRYPGMVGELHRQTRLGVEEGQAVVNVALPGAAAHNLVLGGELLIATPPGQAAPTAAVAAPAGPKTLEEALRLTTSYRFDNQSLEFAMRDLAADVKDMTKGAPFNFEIKIIGGDLEKDGITRNQSIRDFKQDNQPVADILTALVMKANPITTVKQPSELDQKLVWVIGPDPDDAGRQVVLITTRAACAAKGYTLPAAFVK